MTGFNQACCFSSRSMLMLFM